MVSGTRQSVHGVWHQTGTRQISAELVSISTLLSVVTMPLIVGLTDWLTK